METLQVLKRLETYPTFTLNTLANIIGKDNTYAKVYLNRLKKKGIVHHLQRNTYTVQDDPLVIASRVIWPSYISLWAALRYHDLTEQLPNTISVVTPRAKNRKVISFAHTTITFEKVRPSWFFGFSKNKINDFELFIADPEKALLDAMLLKRISIAEIYMVIQENRKSISTDRMIEYILRTQHQASAKRFGWILSSLGCRNIKKLAAMTYKTIIPLDYSRQPHGPIDTKWGVIVNIGGKE